jgi:hypothetical protein
MQRSRNIQCASFQNRQATLKQAKKARSKLEALQEAAMVEEMSNDAEGRFQKYAKDYIVEYKQQGKPVMPMLLQLAKPEPFVSA